MDQRRVDSTVLIKKGAEANLYLEEWHSKKVIMKKRLPKPYRLPQLDLAIRTQRTIHEPTLIHQAKEAGVPTPTIYMIDLAESNIIMEHVQGKQIKQVLNTLSATSQQRLCQHIGNLIGRLHKNGIIHGDLTTSNMILTASSKVVLIDFGLGEHSEELETRAVDLHLMKRALQSTHHKIARHCFEAIATGYAETVGKETAAKVVEKIGEIEHRGRYIEER